MSTAREGSVRFGNTAGVSSRTSSGKMCKNMRDMDHFRDSCRVRFSCVKLRGYHESTESRISIIVRALQENSFFHVVESHFLLAAATIHGSLHLP